MNVSVVNFRRKKVRVVLTIDTSAYADGDVLANPVEVSLGRITGGKRITGKVKQVTLRDRDDEGGLLDLVVLDSDVDLGTLNSAPNISDDSANAIVGAIDVVSYKDYGGVKIARPSFEPIEFQSDENGSIWLAAISRDTKTYTAATDIVVDLVVELDNVNL